MFPFFKRRSTDQGWLAWPTASALGRRRVLLLTPRQFEREVACERVRSTRRSIPFCVLQIELIAASALRPEVSSEDDSSVFSEGVFGRTRRMTLLKKQSRKLVDLLHHNLRMTDEKGVLSASRYGVLLVDTPEMGGRAVLDRFTALTRHAGLSVRLSLQVHDPEGFGGEEVDLVTTSDESPSRRRDDSNDDSWVRKPSVSLSDSSLNESETSFQACVPGEGSIYSDSTQDRHATHSRHDGPLRSDPDLRSTQGADSTQLATMPTKRAAVLNESQITFADEELTRHASLASRITKRSIDIAGATFGLVLTGPFVIAAIAAIKLSDGGPAFFCQTREGRFGRPFTIYKLRTMIVDAEKSQAALRSASHRDGPAFKISRDPRVTRVGRLLRATCLDELPQLINVLKGDMSLVGPRPLPWHESRACERWHRRRLDVRPGLTCTWQVDKAKAETFDDWMRMDLQYIDQIGLMQDLRLIARTVVVPVTGRGGD